MQVLALNEIATPAAAGSLANSVFQLFATKPKPKPTKQTYETGFCEERSDVAVSDNKPLTNK